MHNFESSEVTELKLKVKCWMLESCQRDNCASQWMDTFTLMMVMISLFFMFGSEDHLILGVVVSLVHIPVYVFFVVAHRNRVKKFNNFYFGYIDRLESEEPWSVYSEFVKAREELLRNQKYVI